MVRYVDLVSDTICSLITAPGYSGVAVIRVSGDRALEFLKKISKLNEIKTHTCRLVTLVDKNGDEIDQSLVTYFEKGKSFTGDECIEISCHGNPLIVNRIIHQFLDLGCRSAEKGEFTFRAFYNGNIDLVQAESIQSLIMTNNEMGTKQFINQLSGSLSKTIDNVEESLISLLGHIEANIDFVEEDIEPDDIKKMKESLSNIQKTTEKLLETYDVGKNLQESFKILLLGKTNAGKSSLFNRIIDKDRSIITNIEGTTRDIVSEKVFINNYSVEFLDSAGLRASNDEVEKIGIEKALSQQSNSDLVLLVLDGSNIPEELPENIVFDKLLPIVNKSDLIKDKSIDSVFESPRKNSYLKSFSRAPLFVSAKNGDGIEELKNHINQIIVNSNKSDQKDVITQARHFDHLSRLSGYLKTAGCLLEKEESPDLISQELQLGLSELQELLGKEYNDEILDKIFSDFCIGK